MAALTTHHCGITVTDLEAAVDFYTEVFGFDVAARFSVSGDAFATGVDVANASGRFVHLDAGDARLELVEYEPEGDAGAPVDLNDPGATHLGFAVDNIEDWYETLPETVETLSEPQTTDSGTTICFVRDPEGALVEVLET